VSLPPVIRFSPIEAIVTTASALVTRCWVALRSLAA